VMASGGTKVPQDRIAPPRQQREARVLVARPLADVRTRDVPDVVRIEQQNGAEVGRVERRLRTLETFPAQAREVDALLPVDRAGRVGRADGPVSHGHRTTS